MSLIKRTFRFLTVHHILDWIPDKLYLRTKYRIYIGKKLNLQNPKTFNEKLQWLKLYDRKPEYHKMVDKYEVKHYVAEKIGSQYVIPTIGLWNKASEIDFETLPNQFVLKCTHDSGGVIICKDKNNADIDGIVKKLEKGLKTDYYLLGREWPYKGIMRRIIAEEYLEDESNHDLKDYKVLCFNGVPKLIELHTGRFTEHQTQDFYDTDWNKLSISQSNLPEFQKSSTILPKPVNLDEMITLSRVLSKGIPHVRVDWYSIKGHLYFGELTFFDGSGLDPWDDPNDDLMMGNWIVLPPIKK